jgi:hypothetical protein
MNIIVSFPRSGQHLIENILSYCCKEHNVEFTYCEFYSCCRHLPCDKGNKFSKNHDFDLDLNIEENIKYISLYRNDLILQLESYYRYSSKLEFKEYEYVELLKFISDKKRYYNGFIEKWINNKDENILKIEYYNLLENPEKISKEIFKHFFPDVELNNKVFENLNELEMEVKNTPGTGIFLHKIGLVNKLDDEIYQKIKKDLGI